MAWYTLFVTLASQWKIKIIVGNEVTEKLTKIQWTKVCGAPI